MESLDALVGTRVSLRYRVGDRDGHPLHRDAVGELREAGPVTVRVDTRRGLVPVPRAAIVAVRAVPPAPPRRASLTAIARLENLCVDAWPAVVERRLGAWRLRAAGGWPGRANSALVIGDPGMPIASALSVASAFAAEHGIPTRAQVPQGSPWDTAVTLQGWVLEESHAAGPVAAVLVAPLETGGVGLAASGPVRIGWADRPDAAWWEAGEAPMPAQRAAVGPPTIGFGLATGSDGAVLGRIRAAVVQDHLHLSMLDVRPAARSRGLGTALLAAAAAWGQERGARWAVLQAAVHNAEALALYGRAGFTEHHRYRYLVPPAGPDTS